ncbi:ribonucleoside-diphosphate reductase large subunit [Tupanvirus soda lake]|uniref:Ribonucleoside-diphosphate reductase n=2 Tax=Tupanvirus TaxID=2094720 RepID=A0A6N1NJU4_9VIRU|nr:ribonucleoside-diphosphate reductase large subunit [Tupanvirus soda lake]QKU35059.1 ribonucleoside-diphosphate reductase large subunit [Tupanvirus soda lake]
MNLELSEKKIIKNINKKLIGKNLKKPNDMISLSVANNKKSVKQMKYYKNTQNQDIMNDINNQTHDKIYIINNGTIKLLKFDTIKKYISVICQKMKVEHLDVDKIASNVYPKLKTKNTINEVQDQIVMSASEMVTDHYDYPCIATWILINNLHKNTHDDYLKVVQQLRSNINKKGKHAPIVSPGFVAFVEKYHREINQAICYERDYDISVFGFRTLEKAYLKKMVNGNIIERPQHMYMRVAIALHYRTGRLDRIFETYELLSKGYFTHATPTLFNAGTTHEQLSSCFLLGINDDMEAIGECWKDCAVISKYAGGIGINVTNIRVDGAYINSTQGQASGLRLLTVFNQIARYADQGGKRAGSIAIYIEPWHADVYFFLDLKKNTGAETERARDLFLALMVNDIFMERVENDGVWSLMCPAECPNLLNKFGEEFAAVYEKYEVDGKFIKQVPARDLWFKIMESQIETGVPYIVFKDASNYKSNQINIGVINGSNLCAEILEVSSANEYAVCNLASICLPKYIKYVNGKPEFDYKELYRVARVAARNLNNVIDINFYPVDKTKVSNLKHRPIGIGVQGLADVFAMFKTPFDSELARDINKKIFETIYYGALTESMTIAKESGHYQSFRGSPLSQGKFQFDLWGLDRNQLSGMWDWNGLMEEILVHGVANSLVTTCMPTASTSQIMGNNECIEPYTENIYTRTTLAGEYYIINKHLMKDLMELGLWNSDMVDLIKYFEGSIANIPGIPNEIKEIYRTVWEIPQKSIIDMAADRGPFIDQTQSMNIFIAKASFVKLNSCLFRAWKRGLKTGIYYLRSKAASEANKFGIDIDKIIELNSKYHIIPPVQEITDAMSSQENITEPSTYEQPMKLCPYRPKHLRKPGEKCEPCGS